MREQNDYEEDNMPKINQNQDSFKNIDDDEDLIPNYSSRFKSDHHETFDKRMEFISRFKKILLPLYIIFVIFALYKFLGWYSHRKQVAEEKKATVESSQTIKATAPTVATTVAPPTPLIDRETQEQMASLTNQLQQYNDQINVLKGNIDNQKTSIDALNASLAGITASLDGLTVKVDAMARSLKKPKKIIRKKPAPLRAVYHIKAIVPNRAWLEDTDGRTVTVRLGDIVNDGRVEVISPYQGVVGLSTGEVIQFGANDI